MRIAFAALLLIASPALAENAPVSEGSITCSSPVSPDNSAKSLMLRYGQEAVIEDLPGAEGETHKGLVLFPKAMDRRVEVWFIDDSLNRVAGLTLRDPVKISRWSVAGITIGSSLAEVQKANGKPFLILGFDWDYAGLIADWKGGVFAQALSGGCKLSLSFSTDALTPGNFQGEAVKISSDNRTLVKLRPVVSEISVMFGRN